MQAEPSAGPTTCTTDQIEKNALHGITSAALGTGKIKSTYEPSGPPGWCISLVLKHKATTVGVFLLFPGWDATPLQGYPQSGNCEDKGCCPRRQFQKTDPSN